MVVQECVNMVTLRHQVVNESNLIDELLHGSKQVDARLGCAPDTP